MTHQFLTNKKDIEAWLDKHNVENYTLQEAPEYGYVINVDGHVNLSKQELSFIPVKFNDVDGEFYCNNNFLTTLDGCPQFVRGNFDCKDNQLTTLEFCPKEVYGDFYCEDNPALGATQNINYFAKIFNLHEAIVRIKKEKEQIDKGLLKINPVDNVVKKSVLKV